MLWQATAAKLGSPFNIPPDKDQYVGFPAANEEQRNSEQWKNNFPMM